MNLTCPCRLCTLARLSGIHSLLRKGKVALAMAALDGVISDLSAVTPQLLAEAHLRHRPAPESPLAKLERLAAERQAEAARAAALVPAAAPEQPAVKARTRTGGAPRKPVKPVRPARKGRAQWLADLIEARPELVERAATILRMRPATIMGVAEGRIGLAASAWKKLQAELEDYD
jgi:hypothetical protein